MRVGEQRDVCQREPGACEERRLPERLLQPGVVGVWACGAYFSRGRDSGAPWSRFLRLAKNPPIAVQSAKNIIRQSQGSSIAQGLAWENDGYTFCITTEDAAEGIKAFVEKREPVYRGR